MVYASTLLFIRPQAVNIEQESMQYREEPHDPSRFCCESGTRIVLDEQLLEERDLWKEKYLALQKQVSKDVGEMKETIYNECSHLMQQQFANKEQQHSKALNSKNAQIQNLTSKLIELQTKLKVSDRQKEILQRKYVELEDECKEKETLILMLKKRDVKHENEWNQKLEDDMTEFRRKLNNSQRQMVEGLENENSHLKHKVKEFEKKYQLLIPEVERLKSLLTEKSSAVQSLEAQVERQRRDRQKEVSSLELAKNELQRTHSKCKENILKLNEQLSLQQISLKSQKKLKSEVKVEPIYIEKPVQVEKIVEKIVEVEKVVKEYIEPSQYRDVALEQEFKKLKLQNDQMKKQNNLFSHKLQESLQDTEQITKQYEGVILQYKQERVKLGKQIEELNKELDIVYAVRNQHQTRCDQKPESVKVYLQNNGESEYFTTATTIPRVATLSTSGSRHNLRNSERSTSRNKNLSNSQSRKVVWK